MIKRVIHWTDTHIGARHQIEKNTSKIEEDFLKHKHDASTLVIATGDIVDNKNVKKKKVPFYNLMRDKLKELMGNCYIFGNHECKKDNYYYKCENIIWMHFHVKDWCNSFTEPCSKVFEYETMTPGKGKLFYFVYRFKHLVIKRGKIWKPTPEMISDIVAFVKAHNCDTIFFGHTHKLYDEIHDGVRIINGGRGRRIYDLT